MARVRLSDGIKIASRINVRPKTGKLEMGKRGAYEDESQSEGIRRGAKSVGDEGTDSAGGRFGLQYLGGYYARKYLY